MPQLSERELRETYFMVPFWSYRQGYSKLTNWGKLFTTPAQPTGRLEMEENKSTSTASAPSGSTSTADQENRTKILNRLMGTLHSFAQFYGCPNPWSWAQAWASTCIGPSWKNWGMPSGNLCRRAQRRLPKKSIPVDASRTSDAASVLRTPGTHWRKNGGNVLVQCGPLRQLPKADFGCLLGGTGVVQSGGVERSTLSRPVELGRRQRRDISASIGGDFPEACFRIIRQRCLQVEQFYHSGNIPEPGWHAQAVLASRC